MYKEEKSHEKLGERGRSVLSISVAARNITKWWMKRRKEKVQTHNPLFTAAEKKLFVHCSYIFFVRRNEHSTGIFLLQKVYIYVTTAFFFPLPLQLQ